MDYRAEATTLRPGTEELSSLAWLVTFPDVEELASLKNSLPPELAPSEASWLFHTLCPDWSAHSVFDSIDELPDAPEGDLLFYSIVAEGSGLYVADISQGWQAWFDAAASAVGTEPRPVRVKIASAHTEVETADIATALHELLSGGKYVNFGRPRLTLARPHLNEGTYQWSKARSLAALTKSQREEIEGSYRL